MKVVIRLMDDERRLLGWCEIDGVMRGDGCVRASVDAAEVPVDEDGVASLYNAHWVELHTNLTIAVQPTLVKAGDRFTLSFTRPIFEIRGSEASLPAVTVRKSSLIEVPTGTLGVAGVH